MSQQVKERHGLDDNQQNEVFSIAQSSLFESIKGQVTGGNLNQIMEMFNGKADADQGAVSGAMQNNLVQGLMEKFGFDSDKAGGIAQSVIPVLVKD